MQPIGNMPDHIGAYEVFMSIDETVLLADLSFNVMWLNPKAVQVLGQVAPLYGLSSAEELVGRNMDFFHENSGTSKNIMRHLSGTHRTRINIKNRFIAETVITPLHNESGEKKAYMLMLLDITEQHFEQEQNKQLIKDLTVPLMNIWDDVYTLPVIGVLSEERLAYLLEKVLTVCAEKRASYLLMDVSSAAGLSEEAIETIYKMKAALRLIGTECFIVGVTPDLAKFLATVQFKGTSYLSVKAAMNDILRNPRP